MFPFINVASKNEYLGLPAEAEGLSVLSSEGEASQFQSVINEVEVSLQNGQGEAGADHETELLSTVTESLVVEDGENLPEAASFLPVLPTSPEFEPVPDPLEKHLAETVVLPETTEALALVENESTESVPVSPISDGASLFPALNSQTETPEETHVQQLPNGTGATVINADSTTDDVGYPVQSGSVTPAENINRSIINRPILAQDVLPDTESNLTARQSHEQKTSLKPAGGNSAGVILQGQTASFSPVQANDPYQVLPGSRLDTQSQHVAYTVKPETGAGLKPLTASLPDVAAPTTVSSGLAALHTQTSGSGMGTGSGGSQTFTQLFSQSVPQPLTQNIHKPEWGGAVGDRILWMLGKGLQSAELRITPAHLGPVNIKLELEKEQAKISFASHHPVVREALEQSIPRLREMLNEQNLDLVNVDINENHPDTSHQERLGADTEKSSQGNGGSESGTSDDFSETEITPVVSNGLLDTYA